MKTITLIVPTMNTNTNPALEQLFGDLHAHSILTNAGLDSNQASEIVFHRLRTEDAKNNMDMRSSISQCCGAIVQYEGLHSYCAACGEYCLTIPNEN